MFCKSLFPYPFSQADVIFPGSIFVSGDFYVVNGVGGKAFIV